MQRIHIDLSKERFDHHSKTTTNHPDNECCELRALSINDIISTRISSKCIEFFVTGQDLSVEVAYQQVQYVYV